RHSRPAPGVWPGHHRWEADREGSAPAGRGNWSTVTRHHATKGLRVRPADHAGAAVVDPRLSRKHLDVPKVSPFPQLPYKSYLDFADNSEDGECASRDCRYAYPLPRAALRHGDRRLSCGGRFPSSGSPDASRTTHG